jgi:hypothetical protein
MKNKIIYLLICWLSKRFNHKSIKSCANRYEIEVRIESMGMHIIYTDFREQAGYSREEVFTMLKTVREEEARMKWKCPKPEVKEE